jgi:hypothetical protein
MPKFKMIGISDEVLECEYCGKTDLKKTIVLEDTESGEICYYGSECASKALAKRGISIPKAKLEKQADRLASAILDQRRYISELEKIQDMIDRGYTRYLIGSREIGANLQQLKVETKHTIEQIDKKIRDLQVVS